MNYKPSENDIVNDYIDNLDEDIAPLFIQIRDVVLEAGPDLNESIKWKNCLVYGLKKNIIQTVVGKGKISLIFFEGVQIKDNKNLLEGDGKKTRTMRIKSDAFDAEALKDFAQQAISLS